MIIFEGEGWKVENLKAWPWMPAWMRFPVFGLGEWIYWGKYMRISKWDEELKRYRTTHTFREWTDVEEIKRRLRIEELFGNR